jgi:hypothetical protein
MEFSSIEKFIITIIVYIIISIMPRLRFDISGGDIKMYSCLGWYEYGINKLKINFDEFDTIFPNRKFISINDIIEHVVHVDPGMCKLLLTVMTNFKSILGELERKMRNGKLTSATIIPALNSVSIDVLIDNIHNYEYVDRLVGLIKEDLYMAYFAESNPDVYQETPLSPTFTGDTTESCNIKNKDAVILLLDKSLEHLNTLEVYHLDVLNLVNSTNKELQQILYK